MGLLNRVWGSRQDRFARRALEAVRRAGVAEATYDPDVFAIHFRERPGGDRCTAYLQNIYRELADAGRAERQERIRSFVRALITAPELPSEWEGVAPLLRPVLRPGTFGYGMGHGLVLQSRPTGLPFLAEYVVIDQPESMAYVTTNHHDLWHVTPDVVFDTARRNIATDTPVAPPPEPTSGPRMIRLMEGGDAYWASRLLLAGGLVQFTDRMGGRPVAFVPDTGGVVVMTDIPDAVAGFFSVAEKQYQEAARPISPQAYTVDADGRVIVYPAREGHPAAEPVRRASLVLAAAEYASQADAVAASEEAFVAKLIVAEGNDRAFSVASWAEGVDTLLPRADYVAFSGASGDVFLVPWEVVEQEATLVPVFGLRPERYRVRAWPPADVVRSLRANAAQI